MPVKGGQGGTMGKLEGNGVMTNAYVRGHSTASSESATWDKQDPSRTKT